MADSLAVTGPKPDRPLDSDELFKFCLARLTRPRGLRSPVRTRVEALQARAELILEAAELASLLVTRQWLASCQSASLPVQQPTSPSDCQPIASKSDF